MYRRGIVSEVDGATHRVRVRFPDRDDVESGWLDVLVRAAHEAKDYGLPAKGDQVAVLLDEHDEAGCVLGALYSSADKPPSTKESIRAMHFGDGGLVEYDRETHVLKIVVPEGGRVELAGNASAIALADDVRRELDAIREALNTHTHSAGMLIAASPVPAGTPVEGVTGPAAPPGAGYTPGDVGARQVRSA